MNGRSGGFFSRRDARGLAPLVFGLVLLAPVCAEYLAAYTDSTGDPGELLLGMLIFVPLYGAPALLIREVARRFDLGWKGMILLAAAFGLLQAGVVDQSLFSASYLGIESWEASRQPTVIEPLGISAYMALLFIGGHVIYSICAPIALVEAFRPDCRRERWLGTRGLAVTAGFYLAASVLVLADHLTTESSHASPVQAGVSLLIVCALVAGAFVFGRRKRPLLDRATWRPGAVFVVSLFLASTITAVPETWPGAALALVLLTGGAAGLASASRSAGWDIRHEVAVAAGALVSRGMLAFTYAPLFGEVTATAKYLHNAVLLSMVATISIFSAWRARSAHRMVIVDTLEQAADDCGRASS